MGLSEPSARLGAAIESMEQAVGALDPADGEPTSDALLAAVGSEPPLTSRGLSPGWSQLSGARPGCGDCWRTPALAAADSPQWRPGPSFNRCLRRLT